MVEFDHDAFDAAKVLRSGVVVEADAVADVEHRERLGGADRLQELVAGVDRVGDRSQMRIELTRGDLVKQQPLGRQWRRRLAGPAAARPCSAVVGRGAWLWRGLVAWIACSRPGSIGT